MALHVLWLFAARACACTMALRNGSVSYAHVALREDGAREVEEARVERAEPVRVEYIVSKVEYMAAPSE